MTKGYATTTVSLSTPTPVTPASMCPGTNQQTIYAFTLVATGIFPNAVLTSVSFNQSGTATSADIVVYKLWSGAPGGTLVATSATTTFSGLNTVFDGFFGTTINYWVTADIAPTAMTGRTIIVDPMTTANFTTSSGFRATFGTIVAGGAQTVLLAPTAITGSTSVCVNATSTLSNGVSGGTWTSSNTLLATIDAGTGLLTGISDGSLTVTYQISTGCLTTVPVTINPLPALQTVTGGGSYCAGGTGVHVGLSGSQTGIYYQLYVGIGTVGDPEGTGGPLDFGLQTVMGIYTVVATDMNTSCSRNMAGIANVIINPLPTAYSVTGGGAYCSGGAGFHVGLSGSDVGINYRLYRGETVVIPSLAGTGSALDFGNFTQAGTYTVVATNATTWCTNDMSGSATIVVNPLPNLYTVFGGGDYCAGGAGVHVGLSWSETGVIYVLYNGGSTVGSPVPGTGFLLDLGLQTAPGTYTVVAMDATTYCTRNMRGSATVVVDPVPTVYAVTGGGSYCADGAGLHVGLSGSDEGIMYMLYKGTTIIGTPVPGTGSVIDFGLQTEGGIYTVIGVNSATTCMSNMAGSASITVNPLPNVYTLLGGGNYCDGGTGVDISLSSSDMGVNYQLYNGGSPIGSPVAGTGGTLDMGLQTLAGIYTAVATNSVTMCAENMSGSASVIINPLPPTHNVIGGGNYCTPHSITSVISPEEAGTTAIHIGLDGSEVGIIYLLYDGTSTIGGPVAGTGGALDFGVQYGSGTYTVLAIDAVTLCNRSMTGSAIITITRIVAPSVSILAPYGDIACEGRLTPFHAVPVNGGATPAYLWKVNGSTVGSTAGTYSYVPADGDVITVMMNSSALCAQPITTGSTLIMTVIPPVTPVVNILANPETIIVTGQTVTFTANVTDGGADPLFQWYVNGNAVPGETAATFTTNTLASNDNVKCIVTRNDACSMSGESTVVVTIAGVGVPQVEPGTGIITAIPNPNSGAFTVKGTLSNTNDPEVTLELLNVTGQVVYQSKVIATGGILNEQVKLSNIAAGMYILNVRTENENKTMHIVVQ